MEKEFIPYEQALELKELGYDIPSISSEHGHVWEREILYQQAFRWFRYKGIRFFISSRLYDIGLVYKVNIQDSTFVFHDFNTYEEAERACLNKLIENFKNSNLKK